MFGFGKKKSFEDDVIDILISELGVNASGRNPSFPTSLEFRQMNEDARQAGFNPHEAAISHAVGYLGNISGLPPAKDDARKLYKKLQSAIVKLKAEGLLRESVADKALANSELVNEKFDLGI